MLHRVILLNYLVILSRYCLATQNNNDSQYSPGWQTPSNNPSAPLSGGKEVQEEDEELKSRGLKINYKRFTKEQRSDLLEGLKGYRNVGCNGGTTEILKEKHAIIATVAEKTRLTPTQVQRWFKKQMKKEKLNLGKDYGAESRSFDLNQTPPGSPLTADNQAACATNDVGRGNIDQNQILSPSRSPSAAHNEATVSSHLLGGGFIGYHQNPGSPLPAQSQVTSSTNQLEEGVMQNYPNREQLNPRGLKRNYERFTEEQTSDLSNGLKEYRKLGCNTTTEILKEKKSIIAMVVDKTGLTPKQVQQWFMDEKARDKRRKGAAGESSNKSTTFITEPEQSESTSDKVGRKREKNRLSQQRCRARKLRAEALA